MRRLLAALLLVAGPVLAQTNGWQETKNGWGEIQTVPGVPYAPSTGVASPVAVNAYNLTATGLATPGAITVTPVLSKIGSITTVAGASLVDGDYFTVKYAPGLTVPIEFDATPGNGTTGGRVPYVFAPGDTADQIRDGLITLLNSAAGTALTASSGGAATVSLVLDTPGAVGDTNTENVANAGFAVTGFVNPTAATTVTYRLVWRLPDGTTTEGGAASSTAASVATLTAANFNRLTFAAGPTGATNVIYRTVAPTSPATTGIIYTGTATTVDDTGLAGGGETAPTVDGTGVVTADFYSFVGAPTYGMRLLGGTTIDFLVAGNRRFSVGATSATIFSSSITWGSSGDNFLSSPAAATLQLGAAASATGAAVSQTLQVQSNITQSNVAAPAAFTIIGPRGTGNAAVAGIALQTGAVQASGATAHVPTTRLNVKELHINLRLGDVNVYANNAAAIAGGLVAGDLYRTGADPDPVMIVH